MRWREAPALRFAIAAAIALAVAVTMVALAAGQPWLGWRLAWSAERNAAVVVASQGPSAAIPAGAAILGVSGGGDALRLAPHDLVIEPDGSIPTYGEYEIFLERQARLNRVQHAPAMTVSAADGQTWTIVPGVRPLTALPAEFWAPLVTGVLSFLIAAAIWAFRPQDAAARYLLLSGAAIFASAAFATPYTTRELAMAAGPLRWLNDLNYLGGSLFAAALVGMLFYYPRRIAPRWAGWAIVAAALVWYLLDQLALFGSMTQARRVLVLLYLVATFVLSGAHWWLTRRDPVARAALGWFLLSWLAGVSIFGLGILLPQLFGVDTSGLQSFGFMLFLLIYVGLAFGILRYRLFDLGVWWGRAMAWVGGLIALALFDVVFVFALGLSPERSLAMALLAVGALWFPIRGWLWGRMVEARRSEAGRAQFEQVVEVAFRRDSADQAELWRGLLNGAFAPLRVVALQTGPGAATLEDHGQALALPAVGEAPALRLEYAQGGRRLFTRADQRRADELVGMLRHVLDSREAHERGASVERRRIAGDIHDNLAATLLSALHSEDAGRKDRYIRETLTDLRSVVAEPTDEACDLTQTLARSRKEMAERLEARGVSLDWPAEPAEPDGAPAPVAQAVRAMLREITSNIVKHAEAGHVRVRVDRTGGDLRLVVEDDGVGFDRAKAVAGAGTPSMGDRAARLGGSVEWSAGEGGRGTRVMVRLPREARGG